MPTPIDAEDVPLELPPTDGEREGEHNLPDEIGDLGLEGDDDELIGLDASVGFDRDGDLADLIDDLGADGQRWIEVADVASDQVLLDARDLADTDADENGWTSDNEAAGDAVAHRDDELDDGNLPLLGSDSGGEGFAEDSISSGDSDSDEAQLPPIDAGEGDLDTDDAAVLDSSLLGRIDALVEREPEGVEVTPGVQWPYFPDAQKQVSEVAAPIGGSALVHAGSDAWLWGDGGLTNLDAPSQPLHPLAVGVTHVVTDPMDGSLAHSSDKGLWRLDAHGRSHDLGGPSADPAMIANARLATTLDGTQVRLWAQSRLGTLFVRLADPIRWSLVDSPRPGRRLASDGRRSLAYVHAAPKRPCALVQSQDGGASWFARTIDVSDASLVELVLVCRDVVVLVCDSMTLPVMVGIGDEDPAALIDGLRAPVTLVHEDNEVVLYGCVVTPERVLLVRQPLGRPRRKPSIIESWGERDGAMPVAMSASHRNGTTDLVVLREANQIRTVRRYRLEIERDSVE